MAACGDAVANDNEDRQGQNAAGGEELMCGKCSGALVGMQGMTCANHGDQYVEFKCRYDMHMHMYMHMHTQIHMHISKVTHSHTDTAPSWRFCSSSNKAKSCRTQAHTQNNTYIPRYCCRVATFFCFGHTHFCEECHKRWVQGCYKTPQLLVKKCNCEVKHPPNGTTQASEACFGCSLCRIKVDDQSPL